MVMNTYQVEPSNVAVVSKKTFEVAVLHESEDECEWVLLSGIDPDERHHMVVREVTAYKRFVTKPLSVGCQ